MKTKPFKIFLAEMSNRSSIKSLLVLYVLFKFDQNRYEMEEALERIFLNNEKDYIKITKSMYVIKKLYNIEDYKDIYETILINKEDWSFNILNRYFMPDTVGRREEMFNFLKNIIPNKISIEQILYKQIYLKLVSRFGEGSTE